MANIDKSIDISNVEEQNPDNLYSDTRHFHNASGTESDGTDESETSENEIASDEREKKKRRRLEPRRTLSYTSNTTKSKRRRKQNSDSEDDLVQSADRSCEPEHTRQLPEDAAYDYVRTNEVGTGADANGDSENDENIEEILRMNEQEINNSDLFGNSITEEERLNLRRKQKIVEKMVMEGLIPQKMCNEHFDIIPYSEYCASASENDFCIFPVVSTYLERIRIMTKYRVDLQRPCRVCNSGVYVKDTDETNYLKGTFNSIFRSSGDTEDTYDTIAVAYNYFVESDVNSINISEETLRSIPSEYRRDIVNWNAGSVCRHFTLCESGRKASQDREMLQLIDKTAFFIMQRQMFSMNQAGAIGINHKNISSLKTVMGLRETLQKQDYNREIIDNHLSNISEDACKSRSSGGEPVFTHTSTTTSHVTVDQLRKNFDKVLPIYEHSRGNRNAEFKRGNVKSKNKKDDNLEGKEKKSWMDASNLNNIYDSYNGFAGGFKTL